MESLLFCTGFGNGGSCNGNVSRRGALRPVDPFGWTVRVDKSPRIAVAGTGTADQTGAARCARYSCRSASTGSMFAARQAG